MVIGPDSTPPRLDSPQAYKQFKVCLKLPSRGHHGRGGDSQYLNLQRKTQEQCEPDNQFVLQPVDRSETAGETSLYCIYNPVRGLYVSSQGQPQVLCKDTERWHVTGNMQEREAVQWIVSFLPNFSRENFMVRGPALALVVYWIIAVWEVRRPRQRYRPELLSAALWFMVSVHVLHFVNWATENFVYGSRAFRDASAGHWQSLESGTSPLGLVYLERVLRNVAMPHPMSKHPDLQTCAAVTLLLVAQYGIVLLLLLHACVAALRGRWTCGLRVTKVGPVLPSPLLLPCRLSISIPMSLFLYYSCLPQRSLFPLTTRCTGLR